MIIEKINIKSFGLITDMTLEFSETVNVIEGQNESGKSTIAAFIKYMLYGFEENDSEEAITERKKRINWHTNTAEGSMYVRVKNKRYLITRSTIPSENTSRPTYKEESSIVDLETGSPAFGKLSAGEVFFGVDRNLFDNTAFIGQIGDAGINEDSVRESIENILFSGNERINNQRAAAKISDKMQALLNENGTGGAIVDLANRENELTAKLEACNDDNRRILVKESELHGIKARRAAYEDKQNKLHELDACYSNVMLIQTFDQLHELEEECEKKGAEYNAFIDANTRAGFVPDDNYYTDLTVARKGVNEAFHSLGDAQDAYTEQKRAIGITKEIESAIAASDSCGGEKAVMERAEGAKKKNVLSMVYSIFGAVAAIVAVVFEIVLAGSDAVFGRVAIGVGAALALALAAYGVYSYLHTMRELSGLQKTFGTDNFQDLKGKIGVIAEARAKRDAINSATESARLAVIRAKERYEESKRTLTELILRWGEEPPSSELGDFLDGLEQRVQEFLGRKKELFDEKTGIEITVKEVRRTLSAKSEIDVRAQVSPLKRKALSGINHDEIIAGIADAKARIEEEDRLAFEVESELSLLKGRSGDPGTYYSRIEAVAKRRRDLQDKHKAYFLALDAIRNASDNLRAEISPRLGEYATKLMEIMTDKKYTSFDVSDGLKVTFLDPTGEQKSVDFLSGGTRELAYVAVRAALIDMLYTEKPPICFDESFAHQDNLRAKSMMKAIKQLSEEGCQSFIFTCRGREATIATDVISTAGVYKLSVVEEEIV